jgi:hypothetical protein
MHHLAAQAIPPAGTPAAALVPITKDLACMIAGAAGGMARATA